MSDQKPLTIITGGTSGIGLQIALSLYGLYDIALIYKNNHEKAQLALKLFNSPHKSKVFVFAENIIDEKSAQNVYEKIQIHFEKPCNVLINCAGHSEPKLFLQSTHQDFIETFNAHFFGVVALTRIVVEEMMMHKIQGKILNFSSIASASNRVGFSNYACAKAAIEAFTKCLSLEIKHKKILVNCIGPGLLEDQKMDQNINQDQKISYKEVVELVHYLLNCTTVTGNVFTLDTGYGRKI